jgi:hypothetical protein
MDHFFKNDDFFQEENDSFNEKLSLDELYDRKREVEENRMNIYKKILQRVHTKIKITAKNKYNDQYLFYVVPEFVFGIPRYDVNTCISYIIERLLENGFHVKYTHPNLLFISWTHYIPSYKRQEIKLKTGVVVDGFGNIVSKDGSKSSVKVSDTLETIDDMNTLILKSNPNTSGEASKQKDYKDINSYKPSGIYNSDILNRLKQKLE